MTFFFWHLIKPIFLKEKGPEALVRWWGLEHGAPSLLWRLKHSRVNSHSGQTDRQFLGMIKKMSWIRDDTVWLGLCRPNNINDMKSFWTCFEAESHCVKCRVACSVWSSPWLTSVSPHAWLPVRLLVSPMAESGCLFSRVSLPLTWSGTVSWSVLSSDTLCCRVKRVGGYFSVYKSGHKTFLSVCINLPFINAELSLHLPFTGQG